MPDKSKAEIDFYIKELERERGVDFDTLMKQNFIDAIKTYKDKEQSYLKIAELVTKELSVQRVSKEKELILAQQQLAACPESKIKQYENDIVITQNAIQEIDQSVYEQQVEMGRRKQKAADLFAFTCDYHIANKDKIKHAQSIVEAHMKDVILSHESDFGQKEKNA